MDSVSITSIPGTVTAVVTAVVTIASVAANFVKPDSTVGKILHWFALNFKVGK